jgi:hypothetical protein
MKVIFCWLYNQWLSKAVDQKTDPLVVALDWSLGSSCKYCMAVRALMFGIGLGLFNVFGLVLMALAVLMTFGERSWLCELPKE